jgi:ferredoxin--NADP+ reductase
MIRGFQSVTVTRLELWGPETWLLCWPRSFSFLAGQVVILTLKPGGAERIYSLATGVREPEAGVLFNLVEDGELTPALANLRPGDLLWVSEPFGSFPGLEGPAVWIANGTGVAPFVSMVRSGLGQQKVLIHGARKLAGFLGRQELENLPGLTYYRCCTGEAHELVFSGRLTEFLEQRSWAPSQRYLLCGSAPMIVEVRELLFRKGIPFSHILAEVFF